MRFAPIVAALAGIAAAGPVSLNKGNRRGAGSTVAKPGPIKDMIVNKDTTLNGTHTGPTVVVPPRKSDTDAAPFPISFVNNFGADVKAYLVGTCANNATCFILADGSAVYPSANGSPTPVPVDANVVIDLPLGQTLNLNLPDSMISTRVYFAASEMSFGVVATDTGGNGLVQPSSANPSDPSANILWGFVEFNYDGTIYANISYVDFVGMVLGMQLQDNNGPTQTTQGLAPGAANSVCTDLRAQATADNRPWDKMCITGTDGSVVRVLSPNTYTGIDPTGFADYWDDYVNQVWTTYSTSPLTTSTSLGNLSCTVSGDTMSCDKDSIPYNKPTAADIWGCASGPFTNQGGDASVDSHKADLAILCAAFHRSTYLLPGGNVQPSLPATDYYTVDPTNHYSRVVHKYETDGKGYAFPYDDVNPSDENASGTVSSGTPKSLLIWVGGAGSNSTTPPS